MLRKFLSNSGSKAAQEELKKAQKVVGGRTSKIKHITEIPVTFKVSTLFGGCGLLSGLSLVLVPHRFIESEICLPFPNIHDGERATLKLISLFTVCCSCYGWIGGKVYAFKTFRLGDTKRFQYVLGNLVHKTPLAVLHCAGFNVTIFYGMFGVFTLIETLIYGQPVYGMDKLDDVKRRNMQYGNKRMMAPHKKMTECSSDELIYRCKFALEITAHWTQSTIFLVFPIFVCGSATLMAAHRSYWMSLYTRMSK